MGGLREQIEEAGFASQREFAAHVGMTEEHVSRLVNGIKEPTLLLKRYLATAAVLRRAIQKEPRP